MIKVADVFAGLQRSCCFSRSWRLFHFMDVYMFVLSNSQKYSCDISVPGVGGGGRGWGVEFRASGLTFFTVYAS